MITWASILQLGSTCYNMYKSTRSKLAGENYNFQTGVSLRSWLYFPILMRLFLWTLFVLFTRCERRGHTHMTQKLSNRLTWEGTGNGSWGIMEHHETRNRRVAHVFVAQDWESEVPRLGMGHIPSFWNSNASSFGVYWLKRCKTLLTTYVVSPWCGTCDVTSSYCNLMIFIAWYLAKSNA